MKQKIVIQVHVRSDKCRTKALKIAAAEEGVISVELQGEDRDKVVVTGDRVDAPNLTIRLNKKIGYACLLSLEDVKPEPEAKKEPEKEKEKEKEKDPTPTPTKCCNCEHSQCQLCVVIPDPYPTSNCTTM